MSDLTRGIGAFLRLAESFGWVRMASTHHPGPQVVVGRRSRVVWVEVVPSSYRGTTSPDWMAALDRMTRALGTRKHQEMYVLRVSEIDRFERIIGGAPE